MLQSVSALEKGYRTNWAPDSCFRARHAHSQYACTLADLPCCGDARWGDLSGYTRAANSTNTYAYTYDGAGSRLTATLNGTSTFTSPVYNTANELTAVDGSTLGYDANGVCL